MTTERQAQVIAERQAIERAENRKKFDEKMREPHAKNFIGTVGPSTEQYDYFGFTEAGGSLEPDEDGNTHLMNRFASPGEIAVAGHDVATGQKHQHQYDDDMGEINRGLYALQASARMVNPNGGETPPEDMRAMGDIAVGIGREGTKADYDEALSAWEPERYEAVWMARRRLEAERRLAVGIDNDAIKNTGVEIPAFEVVESRDELKQKPEFMRAAEIVFEGLEGRPFQGSDDELLDLFQEEMSLFAWNSTEMARRVVKVMEGSDEFAKAYYALMVTYDNLDIEWGDVGRGVISLATDPVNYLGGAAWSKAGAMAAKSQIAKNISERVATTATAAALGAGWTTYDDFMRQMVSVEAGVQTEIDQQSLEQSGGIGAAGGAALNKLIMFGGRMLGKTQRMGGQKPLTDPEITEKFRSDLENYPETAKARYYDLPETEEGKVINTDLARELSEDYAQDRTRSAAVHEPASEFVRNYYAQMLKREPTGPVLFTAGGTGSGKTTSIKKLSSIWDDSEMIYDTNLTDYGKAVKKIEQALNSGRPVSINYVYRDPVESFIDGAIPRAKRMEKEFGSGRTVPIDAHVKSHIGSMETIKKLSKKYQKHPNVEIFVIDNTRGRNQQALSDIGFLENLGQKPDILKANLIKELEKRYADKEISAPIYQGFRQAYE